ncbi:hypothetical protein [Bosea thiooxidans]
MSGSFCFAGSGRGVGDQIAVGVAIAGIERAAIRAILRLRRSGKAEAESELAKRRDLGAQHGNLRWDRRPDSARVRFLPS